MISPGDHALEALRIGGKRAMAQALTSIEAAADDLETVALLGAAYGAPKAHVVGLTGPPGVGKSTLLTAVIDAYRREGQSVGAILVDPSSRRSGGALLGDRLRLQLDPDDDGVFVRSMAARERLGGLAPSAHAAMILMRAVYDRVIVETVGVGQSETEVASVCDTLVLCVQPGSGDSVQYMKAGIAEVPDIVVVNKADLGAPAARTHRDVRSALAHHDGGPANWDVPVLLASAAEGRGVDELLRRLATHAAFLGAERRLEIRRGAQAKAWLLSALLDEFGRFGLDQAKRLEGGLAIRPGQSPFLRLREITDGLRAARSIPSS
ncbi:MAG: methylmalonyl Co-A mutase-associated GTPase MeaB [Geminicoccaceae bacterium]